MSKLDEKIKKFKQAGKGKIHVITDFDSTLTYSNIDGKEVPSVISLLRDGDYINPEYAGEAKALAAHYKPIEKNLSLSIEVRKKAMKQWWSRHFELLIQCGLNKKHLRQIVDSAGIQFRNGALAFLDTMNNNNIPVVILSSSGLGETIPMLLEREGRMYDNIHVVTNQFEWDEGGNAMSIREPIIHGMGKDETHIPEEVYEEIKNRKNVLLLGDSFGDLGMVSGFNYDNLTGIGFLNPGNEENKQRYLEAFDVVIENDGDFSQVNALVRKIL